MTIRADIWLLVGELAGGAKQHAALDHRRAGGHEPIGQRVEDSFHYPARLT